MTIPPASSATCATGARPGLGFASGIYAATGQPTSEYSDVNTNGIILEAVAYG